MTAETDLLPCPFCGEGEHLLVEHLEGTILHPAHRIRCDNCGASTGYTDRDFRANWNARACVSSATEALRAERDLFRAETIALAKDAERLAEALRESAQHLRNHADNEYQMRFEDNSPSGRLNRLLMLADRIEANAARAALEQETTNG
jgi:uncharacterized Zn finger protein